MAEILDVVDEKGNPTGETIERSVAHATGVLHHTSHVWIMRNRIDDRTGQYVPQVLLQKRTDDKDSFPGCYDISSAGHIPAGCGYAESAIRELQEELGLSMKPDELFFLGDMHKSIHTQFHGQPYHDEQISRVFYCICDKEESAFTLQETEVSAVLWMDLSELKEKLTDDTFPNCIDRDEIDLLPYCLPTGALVSLDSDISMFLVASKESTNCLTLCYELADEVDIDILRQAVTLTMNRYFYLKVAFKKSAHPSYEYNPRPYYVEKTSHIPALGGEEAGYHFLAFTCDGREVRVHFFHGLVDGGGIFKIAETLLYYYCKFRYDFHLSEEGFITLHTPFSEKEMADPYKLSMQYEKEAKNLKKKKLPKAFSLEKARIVHPSLQNKKAVYIRMAEEEAMAVCKKYEISPSILFLLLFARGIKAVHPDAENIIGGLAMSSKNALGCKESVRNATVPMSILLSDRIAKLDFDLQCTAYRGQVILTTDEERLRGKSVEIGKLMQMMRRLPYIGLTKKAIGKLFASVAGDSYQVSYTGQSSLGAAGQYVKSLLVHYDMPATGCMLEVTALSGSIFISYVQAWQEDVYLDSFLSELEKIGIKPQVISVQKVVTPQLDTN